jgi:hypothetical protein
MADHGDMSHEGPFAGGELRTPPNQGRNTPGRGAGRGRGGGRGRGRGNRHRAGRGHGPRRPAPQTFFGNTDGMKNNVFQCHGENNSTQQFMKTVGVLEEHINKTFDYPQDVASVCKTFTLTTLNIPANLEKTVYETDMAKRMIWDTNMKTYMKRVDKMESNLREI